MPTTIIGNKVKIHLEKNALPGYSLSLKKDERRKILNKLAKKLGWVNIVRKLNVLFIYNKNKHPKTANKFKQDMKYIQKQFSPKYKTQSKKRSKKQSKKRSKKQSKKRSNKQSKKRSNKQSNKPSKKQSKKTFK
jgi:hypothetical protein